MAWAALASQHAHATTNGGTTATVTLPANATVNNRVVLEVSGTNDATPTISVSGLGATWTEDVARAYIDGAVGVRESKFSCVVASAATAITVTVSGGTAANTFIAASAQEYSGLSTTSGAGGVDVSVATNGTGGTPSVTAGAATTAANEMCSGGFGDDGGNNAITLAGAGYTIRDNNTPSTVSESLLEDKDSGASGSTITFNLGQAVAGTWGMTGVVYKLPGGAAYSLFDADNKHGNLATMNGGFQ